jgi:EAL domain-containing protein (putative c-di-GMP-specific phosphodiesterase class I)
MNGGRPVRVGVNVSARQLASDDFERTVTRALELSGLSPALLELELTESVLVENPTETRKRIESLRARGLRVALDDFGTGYASLAYIRHFPMDELKIDRQFVRGLPLDAEAVAITSAIVALARSLRLDIVAEGVENEAEEEFLHSQHCFVVQGFLHARPMFREDFELWRRKRPWA